MEPKGKATLTYGDGKSIEFPVFGGSVGPDVIDIRTLYGKTGVFTYDTGFMSTAACSSKKLDTQLRRPRTMAEPMNGPAMVPVPPRIAISAASTETGNEAATGFTKRLW